jgi:hypothetical protein
MDKNYVTPEMEITAFDAEDVITTSPITRDEDETGIH